MNCNPLTSEADKKTVEIMGDLMARGYKEKAILQDALFRAAGVDPLAFADNQMTPERVQGMFEQFADYILERIKASGVQIPGGAFAPGQDEESAAGRVSPFARNLAQSYASRRAASDE